ncbi:MAG: hypothetical protein NWE88_05380 [Candidatus Bathyarchaeota archaeon]|nr:hypothetical protein [Candidatus Bathyarchaeota archaeon]
MRLIVFTQVSYGERIRENLRLRAPREWVTDESVILGGLPAMVEEIVEGL